MVLDVCELDVAGNAGEQSDLSATVHVKNKQKYLLSGLATKVCKVLSDAGFLKRWQYVFHSMHSSSGWNRVQRALRSVTQMQHIQKR